MQSYWLEGKPLLAIEAVIIGFLELKRFQGWRETGTSGFLNAFPFDPAGASASSSLADRTAQQLLLAAGKGQRCGSSCHTPCLPAPAAPPQPYPPVLPTHPPPAGMNSPSMATKEVKNGRLAMTAFVGFAVQVGRVARCCTLWMLLRLRSGGGGRWLGGWGIKHCLPVCMAAGGCSALRASGLPTHAHPTAHPLVFSCAAGAGDPHWPH